MPAVIAKNTAHRPRRLAVAIFALAALAMLVVAVRVGWFAIAPATGTAPEVMADAAATGTVHAAATTRSEPDGDARVEVTAPPGAAPRTSATRELRGRVFDSRGQPLADVPLRVCGRDGLQIGGEGATAATRSDGTGAFTVHAPADLAVTVMATAQFVTLRTTPAPAGQAPDLQLVVAPRRGIVGLVHDARGLPIAGAHVDVATFLLPEFPWQLEGTLDPAATAPFAAVSGADGRFELAGAPVAAGLFLNCRRDGYRTERLQTTSLPAEFVAIELTKEVAGEAAVHGTVLDANGAPLAGAILRYGFVQTAQSAADGSFRFEFEKRPLQLLAMHPGLQPVVVEAVGPDTPMPLALRFEAPCLSIWGRVLDERGAPVSGALLNLVDPERAGHSGSIEKLSAASPETGLPEGARGRTAADGSFVITGLRDRSYRLRAWDAATAASVHSEPIPAGSRDVTIVLGRDGFVDELRGRVTTRDGQGIPHVAIGTHALVDTFDDIALVRGPTAQSADDGSFVLRRVPTRHLRVTASSEEHEYAEVAVEDCLAHGGVHLVLLRKCYVQVEGPTGLWVTLLDADGKELMVTVHTVDSAYGGNGISLRGGTSPVMAVAETATTMVWRRGDEELGRLPISLLPGRARKNVLSVPQ